MSTLDTTEPALRVEGLHVRYGGVAALSDVSFNIPTGGITGIIGANGAGKTTLIDAVTGFTHCEGNIYMAGASVATRPAFQRMRAGVGRSFQSVELFEDLSVLNNLRVHAEGSGLRRRGRAEVTDRTCVEALDAFGVGWTAEMMPGELPFGVRRLVSLARAVASRPYLLLLDEPAAGLSVHETEALGARLRELVHRWNMSMLLVDHDMDFVLSLCTYLYVLDFGQCISEGTPEVVRNDPRVVEAYFGRSLDEG